jgi:hypothetical protein
MLDQDKEAFDMAIRCHDRAVAETGLAIWVGAEPTFTDRLSESPEWLCEAECEFHSHLTTHSTAIWPLIP